MAEQHTGVKDQTGGRGPSRGSYGYAVHARASHHRRDHGHGRRTAAGRTATANAGTPRTGIPATARWARGSRDGGAPAPAAHRCRTHPDKTHLTPRHTKPGDSPISGSPGIPCRRDWLVHGAALRLGRNSATTSSAFLSSRQPRHTGCLSFPAPVHWPKVTSPTSRGVTQWASEASSRGTSSNGEVFRARWSTSAGVPPVRAC